MKTKVEINTAEEVLLDLVQKVQSYDDISYQQEKEGKAPPRVRANVSFTITTGPDGGHLKGNIYYNVWPSKSLSFYGKAHYNFGIAAGIAIQHKNILVLPYNVLLNTDFNYDGHGVIPGPGFANIVVGNEWVSPQVWGLIAASLGPWGTKGTSRFSKA